MSEEEQLRLLATNGISGGGSGVYETVKGKISSIAPVVVEGNTHYYLCLEGREDIYDIDLSNAALLQIIRYQEGDSITLEYREGYGLNEVIDISPRDE